MLPKEQILLIIYFTAVILFFVVFGVVFIVTFLKRKNKLLLENFKATQRFKEELSRSKIEIQEQTLKNVSWELHDNIGQLLSTAVMQINILGTAISEENADSLRDVRGLVGDSLQEIRLLSRTLNKEVIQHVGIEKSIQVELTRFNKLNFLETELKVSGTPVTIEPNDEIILYRIVQEFFSNTIKHAEAAHLFVHLDYQQEGVEITVKDDGVGFDQTSVQANSGLLNMKSRAEVVDAKIKYTSSPGNGVTLVLQYPFKKKKIQNDY